MSQPSLPLGWGWLLTKFNYIFDRLWTFLFQTRSQTTCVMTRANLLAAAGSRTNRASRTVLLVFIDHSCLPRSENSQCLSLMAVLPYRLDLLQLLRRMARCSREVVSSSSPSVVQYDASVMLSMRMWLCSDSWLSTCLIYTPVGYLNLMGKTAKVLKFRNYFEYMFYLKNFACLIFLLCVCYEWLVRYYFVFVVLKWNWCLSLWTSSREV